MLGLNKIYLGDCIEVLGLIDNNSIDLLIIDPPYFSTNIKVLGDNQWKTLEDYIEWLKKLLSLLLNKLKENGAIYIFHNDLSIMTDILYWLKHDNSCTLRNHIKWNKFPTHNNFSRVVKTYGKNRNYGQTFSEDIYFITKQNDYFETPFAKIMKSEMQKQNISQIDISKLCLSKSGKITGWVSNKLKGTQIPTKEQWSKICKLFKIKDTYDALFEEYNSVRYKFNQSYINFQTTIEKQKELLKPYSEIWEYEKDKVDGFYTSKPVKMLENIIKISTNEHDVVLDCFFGSGSTGVACKNLNREFIGIEKDEKYFEIAKERINPTHKKGLLA